MSIRDRILHRENPDSNYEPNETHFQKYTPSMNESYYNEAALTAKERNALPDSAFGLPRLRAYPLTDASHVKQAVRMFNHCKDPKDQKILAANIMKAAKKYNVKLHGNPKNKFTVYLYRESAEKLNSGFGVDGSGGKKLSDRTPTEITQEHLQQGGSYYNNIFYGVGYAQSVKALREFTFMDFFYPNMARITLSIRLKMVCGGLGTGEEADEMYSILNIRKPLDLESNKPIGWSADKPDAEEFSSAVMINYDPDANWFKVDLGKDLDHIRFCLRLYSVMGEIFLDPAFNPDFHLNAENQAILMDWGQRVQYHYDLYKEAKDSDEEMREIQYLWDLFWNFTDNPADPNVQSNNIIGMLSQMACVDKELMNMNESNDAGELITKEKCNAYLVHDLGLPDDIYLLPDKLEYPIVDKNSVKLAIDNINRVDKEDRNEYAKNLNRKYKEMGCAFRISVDHPYAKYADKNMILYMVQMLMEGDTAVDDEGTSTGAAPEDRLAAPPHKKVEFIRGYYLKNLADKDETQPNANKSKDLKDQDDSLN